jgi:hypothetical protein
MVVTNCGSIKEEWEAQNLYGFYKAECNNKKNHFPLSFIDEVQTQWQGVRCIHFWMDILGIIRYP